MLQVSSNSNIIHLDILFKTMNAITRKSNAAYGLGGGVTQDDEVLKGAKLPTIRNVVRCVRYHVQQGNGSMSLFEASKKSLSSD